MMETECKHGIYDERLCAICKYGAKRQEQEKLDYPFIAHYNGQCPECNLPIVAETRVIKTTRERVLHPDCLPVKVAAQ